jgi:hypothetical protein
MLDSITTEESFSITRDIPVAVTEEHHDNLKFWKCMKNASILYLDAHHDMGDNISLSLEDIECTTQFCAAAYLGIAKAVYWHNPHEGYVYHNFTVGKNKENLLETVQKYNKLFSRDTIRWKNVPDDNPLGSTLYGLEQIKDIRLLRIKPPFILDIDLDAFCCDNYIYDVPEEHEGVLCWEERIEETSYLLARLQQPAIVTITKSQGKSPEDCYVPIDLVDKVLEATIAMLHHLYK